MTIAMIDLLLTRRSVLAMNLGEPGPDKESLHKILSAGIRVPDHGRAQPWRIQVLHKEAQRKLAEICVELYKRENPAAVEVQIAAERDRHQRSPLLLIVTSHPKPEKFATVPEIEQTLSSAAVCQNILLATEALGYNAQWVTDWPAYHPQVRVALGHQADTKIIGFIHIGTAIEPPHERPRPEFDAVVSEWGPAIT